MKILTRYILREHIAPFFFAFFTITFLLIIDFVPKIVNSVLDKDLPAGVVFELIGLNLAWMIALSVPMSVLVATLMAFGRLSSDFEVIALKTSGVNLLRVLLPLLAAGCLITGGMIWFNDQVLPDWNKRARTLRSDISRMRPTLVFRSGMFISDIPGYLIYMEDIDHTTSRVEKVRITETKDPQQPQLIIADYGFLEVLDNGRTLVFTLYDGELHSLDTQNPNNYQKLGFKQQVINISGRSTELERTESEYRTDREMSIRQMRENVSSAKESILPFRDRVNLSLRQFYAFALVDSLSLDTVLPHGDSAGYANVKMDAHEVKRQIENNRQQIVGQRRVVNKYQIEIYKKYSIPAASLSFILIGAPLAILSRRGGMGISIAISIFLFTLYWAFLIGGEDLADRGYISPFMSMWSANFLVGGLGLYLLYLVATERPIFGLLRKFWGRRRV
jgi:lipopolysaccharide export system permease protein